MQEIIVNLAISADEYLKNYQSPGINVSATSVDGRRVHFPANILQRFVTRNGVHGRFRIRFNEQGKYQAIERC
ncbi:DUF2835 domain-containing protein [Dasania sp. GY-MA-18]|uniref:DUF2835 domain-containing protein n=1 Tax=Dasania phycosphaerae TaxID=2950436 RepID=A0A9J6RMA7_9GAMM|nr:MULTISPECIES: DUF2835 domain-containing protein [Dasania]MCR8922888.1 DUF2835 domain-containing protein [Dasania sp. GY-MA-18]MCZ0865319.1 DUF2835 domain-containing protein [Dasania phycosphaerae]MCZ0869044.1 DUF2835 domain-containing protein [Dasania phycosphaerae]